MTERTHEDARNPNRRQALATAGLAAGALLLNEASADDNPAAAVADRTTTIRITRLTATPVWAKVYVKVETNHGVAGWGEITGLQPTAAAALAESLFELLDGENPTRIEHLWQKLYRAHRDMRGGPFMVHTISAIDMALWDIAGKLWGVPVYRLLGGPVRDRVRVYPSATSVKLGTGGPHPFSGNPADSLQFVKQIEELRKRLGPTGTIMFDAHCSMPPPLLIQFANAIQPHDVLFIEEPAVPGNIEVFKRLKQAIHVPLATGERDRTIWGMIPYLQERCVDVLQPDCGQTGGITQVKKIATLAEAYYTPLAPHCTMTDLGATASLHAAAAIPFFLIHEYYANLSPPGLVRKTWSVDDQGNASLPEGPGLGVEVDEGRLAEASAHPKEKWTWPKPKAPDGAVIDY